MTASPKLTVEFQPPPRKLSLENLQVDDTLTYEQRNWRVNRSRVYDWDNREFTFDYTLNSKDEWRYLHVEDIGNRTICFFGQWLDLNSIDTDLRPSFVKRDPPKQIRFTGEIFVLESESVGRRREMASDPADKDAWYQLLNWMYYNKDRTAYLDVDRFDNGDIQAWFGDIHLPDEFTDLRAPDDQ